MHILTTLFQVLFVPFLCICCSCLILILQLVYTMGHKGSYGVIALLAKPNSKLQCMLTERIFPLALLCCFPNDIKLTEALFFRSCVDTNGFASIATSARDVSQNSNCSNF